MGSIAVIGYFGDGITDCRDGQGVKTTILTEELERVYGKNDVDRINTYKWKKRPIRFFLNCARAVRRHDNVIFLCATNGLKILPKVLELFNYNHKSLIHYYVVGGFLQDYLKNNPKLIKAVKKLDYIYVELHAMQAALEQMGFENITYVNKFRRMNLVSKNDIPTEENLPFKLCFFARVKKEKGVEDAIQAVKELNENAGSIDYSLDIYGDVDPEYKNSFDLICMNLPAGINYRGVVDFRESQKFLFEYNALVFPTYYYGEGYPNTIVDAYSSGLPVIASRWHYNAEIINNYSDGILFDTHNVEQLKDAIKYMRDNHKVYLCMRYNCIDRCLEYIPDTAIKSLVKNIK